jgi:hypothetical protein
VTKIDGFQYLRRQQGCKCVVSVQLLIQMLSKEDIPGTSFLLSSSGRRERMAGVLIASEKGGDILLCSRYTCYDLMGHDIMYSGGRVP